MMRSLTCLAAAGLVTAAITLPVHSQETPTFGEEIDVRVVNVEVVVTDRDGNRVLGLKPSDFRLKVDGKEVPVEYFSEIREGRAAAPADDQAEAATGVQGLAPEGKVGTYYLVFIDDYFSFPPRRNEVLQSLKAEVGRLGPEDRMAVIAFDGGRLAVLSNWSSSQSDLQKAFDQAMARKAHGFARMAERRSLATDVGLINTGTADGDNTNVAVMGEGAMRQISYDETLIRQLRDAVGAAVSALRGFGGPEGRKVLLLLSGGWPYSVESLQQARTSVLPSQELPEGESLYRLLTGTANLLGYTIYPVDVPGSQTQAADAQAEGPPGGFASAFERENEGTLHFIAKETGGKPLLNDNRSLALATAAADTRSYYWLGFSPAWKGNDKLHSVKVEVARPALDLRYRTSFRDLSKKAAVSMKVESALLFGNLPGGMSMPMRLGTPVKAKKGGGVEIPVALGLPVDLMTVVPRGGKYAVELELRFAASDANGNSSEVPVLPLKLSSAQPPRPGGFVKYETTLKLKGPADHLVAAVYDPLSGKLATAEADVVAP